MDDSFSQLARKIRRDKMNKRQIRRIKREIIDVKIEQNKVLITTIEGLVKDDKLYNVVDNKEVSDYKKDSITNYQDKLNKLTYTFLDEKLVSINK